MDKKERNIKFTVLAIVCIMIFCFAVTPITLQNDTYYTIAIGKQIVENRNIDMQDNFSWHKDLPYTYPHWLYDTGTYLVYQLGENIGIGGFTAVYIATVILSMILGIILYYVMSKLTKNKLVSFAMSLIIMYLLKDFIAARAQLVTFILFALTILFIEQFLKTKKKRYAIYLIIIPILIANLHCAVWPFYFVLFLPYVAEYLLAVISDFKLYYFIEILFARIKLKVLKRKRNQDRISKQEEQLEKLKIEKEKSIELDRKRNETPYKVIFKKEQAVKWLILIMVIALLTGLLTPLGDTPYTYLIKTLKGNTTQNISEHQPLVLIDNKEILISITLYILLFIFTDTKARLRDFFMIAGLTLLSFISRRQTSMFIIICGIIFAKLITEMINKYDKGQTDEIIKYMTTIFGETITLVIVILLSFILYKGKIGNQYVDEKTYPVGATDYILANLDINNMRIFNEYNYGSYLLFRGVPVFIDSRADLYAPEFNETRQENGEYKGRNIFTDYINISSIATYYEDKFEEYDITNVITQTNSKLNMFLSRDANYKEIYADDNFVIYDRLS